MTWSEQVRALMESEGITRGAAAQRIRRADPEKRKRDQESSRRWKAEHREQNRARDRAYSAREDVRGKCRACGEPMGIGRQRDGTCFGCLETAKLEKWVEVERRWAAGESFRGTAEALGWTQDHLAGEMARMREAGRDLPYRYRNTKRQMAARSGGEA